MIISGVLVFVVFHLCHAEDIKICSTPSGREGVCKSILDCPFLKNLAIREVISKKEIVYLRQSACGFNNSIPLICCPEYGPGTCSPSAAPPDPWSGCCGVTATRSFKKGTYVPAIDQYPWMAIIEFDQHNETRLLCSGALISNRYVVSVAVCFDASIDIGDPKRVRLGEFDVSNPGPDCTADYLARRCTEGARTVPVEDVIVHPGFISGNSRPDLNNIALLRLSEIVPYTDFIRPICLPTMDFTESPPPYLKLYVAGWGATKDSSHSDLLRHVGLPYVDLKSCQEPYRVYRNVKISNEHVCAGGKPGRDSCTGDSGDPLMYEAGPFVEAVGLVSFGFGGAPCGLAQVPSVHTKVFAHDKWIRGNIKP